MCFPIRDLPGRGPGVASGLSTSRPLSFDRVAGLQLYKQRFRKFVAVRFKHPPSGWKTQEPLVLQGLRPMDSCTDPLRLSPHHIRRFKSPKTTKKTAPPVWRGRMVQAAEGGATRESEKLAAETAAVKAAPVDAGPTAKDHAAADDRATDANPYEVPIAGNPVAVIPVTGHPRVSGSRASRNSYRTCANIKSDSSCLGGRCGHGQRSHCQCCSQHLSAPLHAAHNPSIPRGPFYMSALARRHPGACFLLLRWLTVLHMSNTSAAEGCGAGRK